jgi:hypothetical protein
VSEDIEQEREREKEEWKMRGTMKTITERKRSRGEPTSRKRRK